MDFKETEGIKTRYGIEKILDDMVSRGFLKKVGNGYQDSNLVTEMLNSGLTREEIAFILNKDSEGSE